MERPRGGKGVGRFVKGDVVVTPFPYSDVSKSERRPALVVTSLRGDDLILCMITTKNRADGYSISLSSGDFSNGSLPHDSMIRPNRLFTADSNKIYDKRGCVVDIKMKEVVDKIVEIVCS
jgi:mRNA interferase MazF